ncbi:DegT/DnrJ/EryC1/StrS family aminotransferase, partial [Salinimicrobium oceani]
VAEEYTNILKDIVVVPIVAAGNSSVWAQYSIRVKNREEVVAKLKEAGIPTAVHYPRPLHLQECFEYINHTEGEFPITEKISNEILSLPMNPYITKKEI